MNDSRRKRLQDAITSISNSISLLEEVRDEEQESFDNLSEGLQQGEKGEAMEAAVTSIEAALDFIADAISSIEEAQA